MLSPPGWLSEIIERAIAKGIEQAGQELKATLDHLDPLAVQQLHTFAAVNEVKGIANESNRRIVRHIADAMEAKQSPDELMREVRATLEKITRYRLNMLVNTGVVRAVNAGKLFAYEDQGVRQVGIIPEWMPQMVHRDHIHDAKRKKPAAQTRTDITPEEDETRYKFMSRCVDELGDEDECQLLWELAQDDVASKPRKSRYKREAKSSRTQQRREKAERELEARLQGGVGILTAGDDKVCDDCNDIAAQAPYTIDKARDLIPAHPNCRCAFVPYDDERYAPIDEMEELSEQIEELFGE
jgi:hypothetical protein